MKFPVTMKSISTDMIVEFYDYKSGKVIEIGKNLYFRVGETARGLNQCDDISYWAPYNVRSKFELPDSLFEVE